MDLLLVEQFNPYNLSTLSSM